MTYHFFVASIYMYIHQSQMYFKHAHIQCAGCGQSVTEVVHS